MRPRHPRWLLAVTSCVAALLLAGCRTESGQDSGVTVACTITPQPPRVGNATVTVNLSDRTAKPVTGARIKLEADMSHPGMAPVLAQAGESAPGSYVGHLQFSMAGDWVILVQGALANGQKIDRQVDVKGVLPG
jgi:hypothetical protein